jgi:tRNA threonylcarbamoyladenosine biosynthesis protein TsaE
MKIEYSLDDIDNAARRFIDEMGDNRLFAFYGQMGAGKTTFIRALAKALGVKNDVVNSPTFSIVNEYESDRGLLYHFDFYRINNPAEILDIGLYDYLDSGNICFMEWPELVIELLPDDVSRVEIAEIENGNRVIRF